MYSKQYTVTIRNIKTMKNITFNYEKYNNIYHI